MSRENLELARAFLEDNLARVTSDFDREATISRMAELWAPEVELDAPRELLELGGLYRGKDAVEQWWREWYSAWDTLRFEYELVDAGDRVVALLELAARGRSSGVEMPPMKIAWVAAFGGGFIVAMRLYMSHAEALEATGLSG